MFDRINPLPLFRGHWYTLSDYRKTKPTADLFTRALVVVVPLGVGVWMFVASGTLSDPGAILAGLALLAGALLAAFAQLSAWRQRLTERAEDFHHSEQRDRDNLDETAAELLVSSYMSVISLIVLVLGMNFGVDADGAVVGFWAALASTLCSYVVIVFLIALPRLYSAYVNINSVRDELNGFHSPAPRATKVTH